MNLVYRLDWILPVSLAILSAILIMGAHLSVIKRRSRRAYGRRFAFHRAFTQALISGESTHLTKMIHSRPMEALVFTGRIMGQISVPETLMASVRGAFFETTGPERLRRWVRSRRIDRRMAAVHALRLVPDEAIRALLLKRLPTEPVHYVAYAGWYSLFFLDDPRALSCLPDIMGDRPAALVDQALRTLENAGPRTRTAAQAFLADDTPLMRRAVLHVGAADGTGPVAQHLQSFLRLNDHDALRGEAFGIMRRVIPAAIDHERFFRHSDPECRGAALEAHLSLATSIDLSLVDQVLADAEIRDRLIPRISEAINRLPDEIPKLVARIRDASNRDVQADYAVLLHGKLHFLLMQYLDTDPVVSRILLEEWVRAGRFSGLVDFVNTNRRSTVERAALRRLEPLIRRYPAFREYCSRYLAPSLAGRLNVPQMPTDEGRTRIPLSRRDKRNLIVLLSAILALFPAIFVLRYGSSLQGMNPGYVLRRFLVEYNLLFAGYAVLLNGSYLVLLIVSGLELRRQVLLWKRRDEALFFRGSILPAMTLLVPAYNEQETVVESVRSLLTMRYPDYRVIVVNDGSADDTLNRLKEAFELDRVDATPHAQITTAPVRGTYGNRQIPNLLVLDKENGGKADALNAAIVYADTAYVCSIDSDSILEPEALLAMAYPIVTDNREVVAVGGNVLPANGCTVVGGDIREIHPPETRIGRFQAIEYLRSFIAARIGWAGVNALMIISGAFGVFRRQRVLEIGGYLTGTGRHKQDTVGEDMELVVRLVEHMYHQTDRDDEVARNGFTVAYAHNANCWTEVPERLGPLLRQRDRWQRGLIEILSYHKRMLFNPRYRQSGLLGLSYFFLFEIVGPFIELMGYVVVALCLLFGLLSAQVLLLLFTAAVLLGMLVSVGSLYFSENGVLFFKGRDFSRVLLFAFVENLGYRQFLSWQRSITYITYLFRDKGWQHLQRRGFAPNATAGKRPDAP